MNDNAAHPARDTGEWPEFFGDCCPPEAAQDLDTEIFYLVSTLPPEPKDFECALERRRFLKEPHCLRVGLSCALAVEVLQRRRDRVPRLRNYLVVSARLGADDGKYEQTTKDRGHYTMWLRRSVLERAPQLFAPPGGGL